MQKILELMLKTAKLTGDFQKQKFGQKIEINQKSSHSDLVTEVDLASQDLIVKNLLEGMQKLDYKESEIGFVGEENFVKSGKYTFVIDPLDGTSNFATGIEFFSVIISLFIDNELQTGVVYRSLTGHTYFAVKDFGSYKLLPSFWENLSKDSKNILADLNFDTFKTNDSENIENNLINNTEIQKLKIEYKPLDKVLITGAFSAIKNLPKEFTKKTLGIRIIHGFGLEACLIAENITAINLGVGPKIWDIAAPKLIIEEAGGVFLNYEGKIINPSLTSETKKTSYPGIICHPKLWEEIKSEFLILKYSEIFGK